MDSVLSNEVARRIAADLTTLVSEAEKHGTLPRIKSVAFYFNETELRTIIKLLRSRHGILAPAQSSRVSQHIGWLKQYIGGMTDANLADMRLRAERQLEELSDLLAAQPPAAPVEPLPDWKQDQADTSVLPRKAAPVEPPSSIETCRDCGVCEPCDESCPNYIEPAAPVETDDLVEVVIACCNGQMGREAAIEVISELDLAGFKIVPSHSRLSAETGVDETCHDCGKTEPCDEKCPNHIEPTREPVAYVPRSKAPGSEGEPLWREVFAAKWLSKGTWQGFDLMPLYSDPPQSLPPLNVKSVCESTKDRRCIEVWLADPVTPADRAALTVALSRQAPQAVSVCAECDRRRRRQLEDGRKRPAQNNPDGYPDD